MRYLYSMSYLNSLSFTLCFG